MFLFQTSEATQMQQDFFDFVSFLLSHGIHTTDIEYDDTVKTEVKVKQGCKKLKTIDF